MCVPKRTFNLSYFKSSGSFTGHINKLIFEILKLSYNKYLNISYYLFYLTQSIFPLYKGVCSRYIHCQKFFEAKNMSTIRKTNFILNK